MVFIDTISLYLINQLNNNINISIINILSIRKNFSFSQHKILIPTLLISNFVGITIVKIESTMYYPKLIFIFLL